MQKTYTIQQLADLAGISVRTLHHYDAIGLLTPARAKGNGYRHYEEKDLLHLQQILFFRELEFPLDDIKKIMTSPGFDMKKALSDHRTLIELKQKRLNKLIETIDKTIQTIDKKNTMSNEELYDNFNTDEVDEYAQEAKEHWGNTEAYKQSQERYGKLSKEEKDQIKLDSEALMQSIVANRDKGIDSPEIQALIGRHYNNLRTFYEPSLQMYRGLADMYVADPRFAAYYEKHAKGLAQFMHDAMIYYIEAQK